MKKPTKTAAKKPAPAKKPAAAKKPAKAAPKKAAPVKSGKPVAPKKVVKAAAKPAAKTPAKKTATPAPAAKAPKAQAAAPAKAPAKVAPTKETPAAKTASAKDVKAVSGTTPAPTPKGKAAKEPKSAPVVETIPALADVKRPAKPFFMEVKPGVERVIKRGDKTAASQAIDLQARRKGPTAEETSEELAERIERELQSQSFLRRAPMRRQMCTKCGINAVVPRFTIDRELGYCDSCAEILRLGETKEAKRMEFNLAPKKENEGEAGEPEGPAAEDAEEEAVPEDLDD